MATIYIYGEIGKDAGDRRVTTDAGMQDALAQIDHKEPLSVRLNTPGGDVAHALAMAEMLADHGGPIDGRIDGIVASAGTFLAATLPKVKMASRGLYMIHDPWSGLAGTAEDHRKEADILDKVRLNLAQQYADKSKLSLDEVLAAMAAETWYTAEEALAIGLIDEIAKTPAKAMRIPKKFGYKNTPMQLLGGTRRNPKKIACPVRDGYASRAAAGMGRGC